MMKKQKQRCNFSNIDGDCSLSQVESVIACNGTTDKAGCPFWNKK